MEINYWAVLAAALSMFVLGGLWYSPILFGRAWMKANNLSEQDLEGGNPAKIYGVAFVFSLLMSANLAAFLSDPATDMAWGATAGFLAGFGWVALGVGVISLFERRPWSYLLVNGGYMTIAFTVMGLILGAWR
ncbi:MAG TPA: DUF1761 domain-containing protein [Acidobacteriota bacterium]|nr:DUF1761 domain-containing protein [Acidobacteriota bacterium]